jgi:hypothetical protein
MVIEVEMGMMKPPNELDYFHDCLRPVSCAEVFGSTFPQSLQFGVPPFLLKVNDKKCAEGTAAGCPILDHVPGASESFYANSAVEISLIDPGFRRND